MAAQATVRNTVMGFITNQPAAWTS
jgi:hypothetical protein